MKHFINILVLLILVFFAVGITYITFIDTAHPWALLYIPLIAFMGGWGCHLVFTYEN